MGEPIKNSRGRPKSAAATSHEAILDAVYELLQEKSVRDLTIEAVAKKAGVGKPTIYKWWPSKVALVLDMFEERVSPSFSVSPGKSAEESIRIQVARLIELSGGFFGKVSREIIAEGQSEPEILREYYERYMRHRRAYTANVIEKASASGEFKTHIDPETLIDMIYGPIYYRILVKHQPLDQKFGEEIVDHVMAYLKA